MSGISSGIGLVSGINYRDIIDNLMRLESRSKDRLQAKADVANERRLAYVDLSTRLASLRLSATTLKKPSTFQQAAATSSNPDVITASASLAAAPGSYQLQVARLVSTQQSVTAGFAAPSSLVGAGTITIEAGGGNVVESTPLARLNGGEGVRRGSFKITDRAGRSSVIDISDAVTLDDVVRRINTALEVSVTASLGDQGLILTDLSGSTLGNFIVQDLGGGSAAADLGLVANVASAQISGSAVATIADKTALSSLNDGRGVRRVSGADLQITVSDGSTLDVDVGDGGTLGSVIAAINAAGAGKVTASIRPDGRGIRLTDISGGGGSFSVANANGSRTADDLGLNAPASGGQIDGRPLIAKLGTVLLSSLRGGAGVAGGQIQLTDAAGASATIDLADATDLADLLGAINDAGIGVRASVNAAGNGILLSDASGGSGPLVVADLSGSTAADLGIAGSHATRRISANVQRQWVHENMLLRDYNAGRGVTAGNLRITNSAGVSATINIPASDTATLGDVIARINAANMQVTASINANGDGLLVTDSAGGAGRLKVEDVNGSVAADLNIRGEATGLTIDGTFEKTLSVGPTDTLETVQANLNAMFFGISAQMINDGSGLNPYRLSLTSINPGRAGQVMFDAGSTGLEARTLVEAQDASVFLGGSGSDRPLLITSGKNQIVNAIRGVTLELHSTSTSPVTVSVSRTADKAAEQLEGFVTTFNDLAGKLKELSSYDAQTNKRGLLFGQAAVQQIQSTMYSMLQTVVPGAGRFRILADVGVRVGEGGVLEFDQEKFRTAYAADAEAVQRLFTQATGGAASAIESRISRLIDPVSGVVSRENQAIDQQARLFADRIDAMDKLLAQKRARLERQFSQLEGVLGGLQSQQQAISQISRLTVGGSSN